MAIKDWKQSSRKNRWKNNSGGHDLEIVKKPKSNIWAIFLVLGDGDFGYLDFKKVSKDFTNEKEAKEFAQDYMTKH